MVEAGDCVKTSNTHFGLSSSLPRNYPKNHILFDFHMCLLAGRPVNRSDSSFLGSQAMHNA